MKAVGGGYRPGSGIGKSGRYNGIWCDSSWELAFVLWCELKGKRLERNKKWFKYYYDGKIRKYYPDFIVDGEIIEIKGRREADDLIKAKCDACPGVKLLLDNEMKPILAEVITVFGNDFVRLYGG